MKQIFAMLFAVAVFIAAVAAEAATLRSEAVIRGDRVLLGDLFDGLSPDLAGTAIAGTQQSYRVFLENCHVHVARILAALTGAPPPPDQPEFARPES